MKQNNNFMDCPKSLQIVSGKDWGAAPPCGECKIHKIRFITIHHSGEFYSDDKDTGEYLRYLQDWCRNERNWENIPYHYIIDPKGIMYECRNPEYMGETATEYNPEGHLLITILGNFEEQKVNKKSVGISRSIYCMGCEKVPGSY